MSGSSPDGVAPAGASPASFSVAAAWLRALAATAELGEHSLLTLPALVEERAARDGDAVAVIAEQRRLSYRQLSALANRYARWAMFEGVRIGEVVGLLMRNSAEYLAIWLGITRVGGVVALFNTRLAGASLAHCINSVSPKQMIVDPALLSFYRSAEDYLASPRRLWILGDGHADAVVSRFPGGRLREWERRPVTLSHKALLIFTSGTTGLPKAANVSHHRIMTWSRWFSGMTNVGADDRIYNCLPLYHSVGGIVAPGAMLVGGGSIVVREKFSATRFWSDVVETGCTQFQYIGELCRYLVNAPPCADERAHRLRLCCGNGLRRDVWEKFQQRFHIPRIIEFYAATEGNFSLFNVEGKPGAIGRVPPFLSHRFPMALIRTDPATNEPIRGPQGGCVKARVDETGEAIGRIGLDDAGLVGRFEGYTSESETEKKILRNVFAPGDAWFRTGDLMRMDSRGFYHFVDRVGDTFRWKGENVATSEVEATLLACEGVEEALVYGVPVPGCEGKAGMAALVVNAAFDLAALYRHVAETLPDYARPLFLRFCPELEITDTFKQKNRRFIEEAYDADLVADELYFDDRVGNTYVRMDSSLLARIDAGHIRL